MANRRSGAGSFADTLLDNIGKALSIAGGLLAAGFGVGCFVTNFSSKLDKMSADAECERRVQAERERFNEYKQSELEKKNENMLNALEFLKNGRRDDEK